MTLKEEIFQALLECLVDPSRLQAVTETYSGSKGPYYAALAQATAFGRQRLEDICRELATREASGKELDAQVDSLETQRREIQGTVERLGRKAQEAEEGLAGFQGVLKRLEELERRGFGEAELVRLADLLGAIAAAQGAAPEDGVAQFFETVDRYDRIVSLDLEASRAEARAAAAKAEAERWEAEARLRETRCRAQTSTIDMVEDLLDQGVKEGDLLVWKRILGKAGIAVGDLAAALDAYAPLEDLLRQKRQQADALQGKVRRLETQVQALKEERQGVHAAIAAVRERTLRELQETGRQAQEIIAGHAEAVRNHERLRGEAAQLGQYVTVGRAIQRAQPDDWQALSPDVMLHLLLGILLWFQRPDRDIALAAPQDERSGTVLTSYSRMKPSALLRWVLAAMLREPEVRALVPGVTRVSGLR